MKSILLSAASFLLLSTTASAKVWRVNNNTGTAANFSDAQAAVTSTSVVSGDTLHLEPSASQYNLGNLSKSLVIIGPGYLLSGADGNSGLQADARTAQLGYVNFLAGSSGTRLIGVSVNSAFSSIANPNVTFEKCRMEDNTLYYLGGGTYSNITFRKCFFAYGLNQTSSNFTNLVIENCIFSGANGNGIGTLYLSAGTGTNCIFRNNVVKANFAVSLSNFYVANNVFSTSTANNTLTGSNVKNNLFSNASQTLPVGATNNQLGVTEASIFTLTGSSDARYMLKAGSPAIAAGATVGSVVTPDAGAYGGPDPYKISGIPAVPTIYSITAPTSIPQGQSTINVTFSTRSNN